MNIFMYILLGLLLVCAISVTFSKNLLNSILIFMAYSLVMSIIWVILESPDLAITEAAVGAGVTSILFFITLKKIHGVLSNPEDDNEDTVEAADDSQPAEDQAVLPAADDSQPAEDQAVLPAADDSQPAEDQPVLPSAADNHPAEDRSTDKQEVAK